MVVSVLELKLLKEFPENSFEALLRLTLEPTEHPHALTLADTSSALSWNYEASDSLKSDELVVSDLSTYQPPRMFFRNTCEPKSLKNYSMDNLIKIKF